MGASSNHDKHEHKHRKDIVNRLARIEGHVRAIKEMTSEGRDCPEILLQIGAVQKALDKAAKLILKDHLGSCVVNAVKTGNHEKGGAELRRAHGIAPRPDPFRNQLGPLERLHADERGAQCRGDQ